MFLRLDLVNIMTTIKWKLGLSSFDKGILTPEAKLQIVYVVHNCKFSYMHMIGYILSPEYIYIQSNDGHHTL